LLSEIFHQGKLLEILRRSKAAFDKCFKVSTTEKVINSRTLYYMGIIKKIPQNEKGMEISTAESELIRDFPSILKEDNPKVLAKFIAAHDRESGTNIQDEVAPDEIKGKRARVITELEAAAGKAKKQKVAKSEVTKKRRGKADTSITKEKIK
jgi:hypothetical protein